MTAQVRMRSQLDLAPRSYEAEPIRLAVLGGGAVTWAYYAPALRLLNGIELTVIVDPASQVVGPLRDAGYQGEIAALTFERFLQDRLSRSEPPIDAVVIALPNALHEAASVAALNAGLHVLCEKPLALSEAACRRIDEAARRAGKIVRIGMVRRYIAAVAALREALRYGLAGPIHTVQIADGSEYQWLSDSGAFFRPESGGVLADMGVHYLDLVQHLLGPLEPVSYADDWRGGCEANATFRLQAANGAAVELKLSRDHHLSNRILFAGDKGQLTLEKENFATCFWQPHERDSLCAELRTTRPFVNPSWPIDFTTCFAQQLHDFAACIRGSASANATVEEATQTVRLIEWAYQERTRPRSIPAAPADDRPRFPDVPIVVTGGSGFIGGQLVERLASVGCRNLKTPVRNYRTCMQIARFPVAMSRMDLLDPDSVRQSLKGARFVFHLAYGRDGADAAKVTIRGTKNVVEAAIADGAECVVVLSTAYVFGQPKTSELVDETWPYAPVGGEYGRSKAIMEQWCLGRAATSETTRLVVLNPTCVYGPKGKTYTTLPVLLAQAGGFCWVDEGTGAANYNYVDNLIDALLLAAATPAAHGMRFMINDGWCTWREFLEPLLGKDAEIPSYTRSDLRWLAKAGPRARWRDLVRVTLQNPEFREVARRLPLAAGLKKWMPRKLRYGQPPRSETLPALGNGHASARTCPPEWLADLFASAPTRFSSERAKKVLGWQPRITLAEGQSRTI